MTLAFWVFSVLLGLQLAIIVTLCLQAMAMVRLSSSNVLQIMLKLKA